MSLRAHLAGEGNYEHEGFGHRARAPWRHADEGLAWKQLAFIVCKRLVARAAARHPARRRTGATVSDRATQCPSRRGRLQTSFAVVGCGARAARHHPRRSPPVRFRDVGQAGIATGRSHASGRPSRRVRRSKPLAPCNRKFASHLTGGSWQNFRNAWTRAPPTSASWGAGAVRSAQSSLIGWRHLLVRAGSMSAAALAFSPSWCLMPALPRRFSPSTQRRHRSTTRAVRW